MKPTGLSARYCKWMAAFLASILAYVFLHVFRTDNNRPSVHKLQLLQRL